MALFVEFWLINHLSIGLIRLGAWCPSEIADRARAVVQRESIPTGIEWQILLVVELPVLFLLWRCDLGAVILTSAAALDSK